MAGEFGGDSFNASPHNASLSSNVGADMAALKVSANLFASALAFALAGRAMPSESADAPATTAAEKRAARLVDDGGFDDASTMGPASVFGMVSARGSARLAPTSPHLAAATYAPRRIASPRLNSSEHIAAASVPMNASPAPVVSTMSSSRSRLAGAKITSTVISSAPLESRTRTASVSRDGPGASSLVVEDVSFASASTRAMTSSMDVASRVFAAAAASSSTRANATAPRAPNVVVTLLASGADSNTRIIASPKLEHSGNLADGYVFDVTTASASATNSSKFSRSRSASTNTRVPRLFFASLANTIAPSVRRPSKYTT